MKYCAFRFPQVNRSALRLIPVNTMRSVLYSIFLHLINYNKKTLQFSIVFQNRKRNGTLKPYTLYELNIAVKFLQFYSNDSEINLCQKQLRNTIESQTHNVMYKINNIPHKSSNSQKVNDISFLQK